MSFFKQLEKFLAQAKTQSQKTKHYDYIYQNSSVNLSFGKGNLAKIPWTASILYKVNEEIKVYSGEYLEKKLNHPAAKKDHYLMFGFDMEHESLRHFRNHEWNFKHLQKYKDTVKDKNPRSAAAIPFCASLTELIQLKK